MGIHRHVILRVVVRCGVLVGAVLATVKGLLPSIGLADPLVWGVATCLAGWVFDQIPARCPGCKRMAAVVRKTRPVTYRCRGCSYEHNTGWYDGIRRFRR